MYKNVIDFDKNVLNFKQHNILIMFNLKRIIRISRTIRGLVICIK